MLKWIALMIAAGAAPVCSAEVQALALDGMRLETPQAEFITSRPAAVGGDGWYMYEPVPQDRTEFGFPVRGYLRGFEKGQGCAAAVGFRKTSAADTERLQQGIEAELAARNMVKTDTVDGQGSRSAYWESQDSFAMIDRGIKGSDHYAISLQVALKRCPDSVQRFQARPPAAAKGG